MSKRALKPSGRGESLTLTVAEIYALWSALTAMERDDDLKVDVETRFSIAININRLVPFAAAYETARSAIAPQLYREHREKLPKDYPADKPLPNDVEAQVSAKIIEADQALRTKEQDVTICLLTKASLRLADNPKIRLSPLLPIIEDID